MRLDPETGRIVDANANRAREALRVMEDYARFALNDSGLTASLKELRHELSRVLSDVLPEAMLHRDTPADVGTVLSTPDERHRSSLAQIVTASGKRLGEALRSLEEALKIGAAEDASSIETLRYRFYDIEARLLRRLRPGLFDRVRLYVIVTEKLCRRAWQEVVEAAIAGGADCVQLREKELCGAELLIRARQLVQMCRRHGVLSIINDRPDIALLSGADGVHVGQDDLPAAEARKIIGHNRIVGVSTHDLSQAQAAERDGADYIGVGPVFHSTTKPRPILPGLEFARAAASQVKIPSVAIAGINPDNLRQVLETGIRAVAISSAILASDDPADLTRKIKNQMLAAEQTIRSA